MRRAAAAVREFIFPTLCCACGEASGGEALCRDCLEKYAREQKLTCLRCHRIAAECDCGSECGVSGILYRSFYLPHGKESGRVTEKLLYKLKTRRNDALCELFAREAAVQLMRHIVGEGRGSSDYTLTYIPRSRAALRRHGFDHAREVARRISRLTGIPLVRYLKRSGGREQKQLSADARLENVRGSLSLDRRRAERLRGARVVLFDDIATTGASLARSRELLLEAGSAEVVPLVLARTRFR